MPHRPLRLTGAALVVALGTVPARADWLGPSEEKSGPFMVNVRGGAAIGVKDTLGVRSFLTHAGSVGFDLGVAVTPARRGYVLVPVEAIISPWYIALMFGVGFEYDVKLPVRGLYLSNRLTGGYAPVFR